MNFNLEKEDRCFVYFVVFIVLMALASALMPLADRHPVSYGNPVGGPPTAAQLMQQGE